MSILDSGDRTQFETGALRDMHTGKGRMDLLPLTAIIELSKHCEEGAIKYGEHNVDKGIPQHSLCDSAMRHLVKYMRGDKDEDHLRAACWNLMFALEQSVTKPEMNDLHWNKCEIKVGDGIIKAKWVPTPIVNEYKCPFCNNYTRMKDDIDHILRNCPICNASMYSD